MVDFSSREGLVAKITNPPGFGLIPCVLSFSIVNLRDPAGIPKMREAVEFVPATPLEYLERWMDANELFNDDVHLVSVIEWADGQVSFGITQPQYHGQPADPREIEHYFIAAGWTPIPDNSGHRIFYNYNWQVMAIDAEPRNCYINQDLLLPFDVILCRPDEALEKHLGLYPG